MEKGDRYKIPEGATIRQIVAGKEERISVTPLAENLAKKVYPEPIHLSDVELVEWTLFAVDQSENNPVGAFTPIMAERILNGKDRIEDYHPNGLPDYRITSQNAALSENNHQEPSETPDH